MQKVIFKILQITKALTYCNTSRGFLILNALIIWAVREWKPKQREAIEFKIMSISHGEEGRHH